jgi:predicted aconitase with swiveling domain
VIIKGNSIVSGIVKGESIVSYQPISFLGDIDPNSGKIVAERHPLKGMSISGKVFIFPFGKGSTVGSYVIYQLYKNNKAPVAFLTRKADPIVAVGAIISGIPMMDDIDVNKIPNGVKLSINTDLGTITY